MESSNTSCSNTSLKDLWNSFESFSENVSTSSAESLESTTSFFSKSAQTTAQNVNWLIENRGGLALLTGLVMVPSQFLGPDFDKSHEIIDNICDYNTENGFKVEKIQMMYKGTTIHGVVCYPPGWNVEDKSRCVLYHNPNGITALGYFEEGSLSWTPGNIFAEHECPIILYDYRGTGLSQKNQDQLSGFSFGFKPTYETVVEDGTIMTAFAFDTFDKVDVWGSSLGGGVSTASLERHLSKNPKDAGRATLYNHDSFSTTSRVVLPGAYPFISNTIGNCVGGNLDAATPMKKLMERDVKVIILCHREDPVIPEGARMIEEVQTWENKKNVFFIDSPRRGHANFTYDMVEQLHALRKEFNKENEE